ncbi:MAG: OsmC family protein [Acidobacteria bacterium]|nr:OsmC family protein [Acidobacteriota bacterium]
MEVKVIWSEGMAFESHQNNHKIMLDAEARFGGQDKGPPPKTLVLSSLAGCTAMDVISILNKMKISPESFKVKVEADLSKEHPKVFTRIHLTYFFQGNDLPLDKLEKAVNLSQEKYCGVSAMLSKVCPLSYEIITESA